MLARTNPMKRSPLKRLTALKKGRGKLKRMKSAKAHKDRLWAKAVKERDGGICQRCGERGTDAHHKATRGRRPDLRHELSNGVLLCRSCHQFCHLNPIQAVAAGLLSDETYERRI